jgi:hypothetical protein
MNLQGLAGKVSPGSLLGTDKIARYGPTRGEAINPLARSPQISAISSDSASLQGMAKIFSFWLCLLGG